MTGAVHYDYVASAVAGAMAKAYEYSPPSRSPHVCEDFVSALIEAYRPLDHRLTNRHVQATFSTWLGFIGDWNPEVQDKMFELGENIRVMYEAMLDVEKGRTA